ncbi:MAG: fatty acid desaturase family protein [Bdellovibrionia bacterium]
MSTVTFDEKSSEFGKVLKKRVYGYLKDNNLSQTAARAAIFKILVIAVCTLGSYFYLLLGNPSTGGAILTSIFLGIVIGAIGFNILHESVHGNLSKNPKISRLSLYAWELLGACHRFYNFRHVIIHHSFTNIPGVDADLENEPLLRFTEKQAFRPWHRYQHWYAWFLYPFITLEWIWHADWVTNKTHKLAFYRIPMSTEGEKKTFYFFKFTHLLYALVIPSLLHPVLSVLGCYFLALTVSGFILGIVFNLAHALDSVHYPEPDPKKNQIAQDWASHQIRTTKNFANSNPILSSYLGGLNYQVEHHLFPRIHHSLYPKIKPIVMQTCAEFNLQYQEYRTLAEGIASHFRHLYAMGHPQAKANVKFTGEKTLDSSFSTLPHAGEFEPKAVSVY